MEKSKHSEDSFSKKELLRNTTLPIQQTSSYHLPKILSLNKETQTQPPNHQDKAIQTLSLTEVLADPKIVIQTSKDRKGRTPIRRLPSPPHKETQEQIEASDKKHFELFNKIYPEVLKRHEFLIRSFSTTHPDYPNLPFRSPQPRIAILPSRSGHSPTRHVFQQTVWPTKKTKPHTPNQTPSTETKPN